MPGSTRLVEPVRTAVSIPASGHGRQGSTNNADGTDLFQALVHLRSAAKLHCVLSFATGVLRDRDIFPAS